MAAGMNKQEDSFSRGDRISDGILSASRYLAGMRGRK
jgi:hypothetical protein